VAEEAAAAVAVRAEIRYVLGLDPKVNMQTLLEVTHDMRCMYASNAPTEWIAGNPCA
jgi:hypothetical protein